MSPSRWLVYFKDWRYWETANLALTAGNKKHLSAPLKSIHQYAKKKNTVKLNLAATENATGSLHFLGKMPKQPHPGPGDLCFKQPSLTFIFSVVRLKKTTLPSISIKTS